MDLSYITDPVLREQYRKRLEEGKITSRMAEAAEKLKTAKEEEKKPKFIPTLKETIAKVGKFTPGEELARGIAYTIAGREAAKSQEDLNRRQRELDEMLMGRIKEAKAQGDSERVKRLVKAGQQTKAPSVIEAALEEAPTTRQVIASAAELALLAGMGYKPYLPTGKLAAGKELAKVGKIYKAAKAVKVAEKLKGAGLATKILVKGVKPIVKEAAIGAGFFGAMKATERDATIKDIIKSAETGALISGGVTAGAIGIGKGLGLAGKYLKPRITKGWEKAMIGLEKAAIGKPLKIKGKGQLTKTLSYIGEAGGLKPKFAQAALKVVQATRKIKMRLIDRFAPGMRIEQRIAEATGKPLKESEKVYRDMRLLTAISDARAEKLMAQYSDDLIKAGYKGGVAKKSEAWLAQLDFIDRARLGQKVPGNQSIDDLMRGLKRLTQEIGPDDMKKVAEVRRITHAYNNNLLQMRVKAGLISQGTVNVLRKTHPNYIPHNVIMAVDERIAQGLSQSLNVAKTDIMKAVGSAKNIRNPITATIQRTQIATRVIEKNKLLNNFVKAQEELGIFPGMEKVTTALKPKTGFGIINLFRNGVKERWQVPGDIAVAIKNLDAPLTPGWWKLLTLPQKILKKGATQYNLSFALPNKFRDEQTAALTANAFIREMAKKTGVSPKAINLTSKQIKDLYKISGGYGSSVWIEGESKILTSLQKTGMSKNLSYANPAKIVNTINETLERSTRLKVFKKALQAGLLAKDAALVSRNATIDFARMGTWMKPLNQAIPFLNARVQGFINLPKALVASPEAFARMQMYTSVYPTMLIHQHNRRFESYKNISQYFKNRYWVIMTGETDAIDDYTGQPIKVPQFITLPKGEGQQLVSSPIQYYLEKADGVDFRKTSEMIADTIGSASPMEFQQFDQANWITTGISQFGPLATIATGKGFGKHPYFGTEIIPEARKKAPTEMQFRKTTPEVTKELANIIGVAPAELEFYINTFGGLPKDLQRGADMIYNVVREGKLGGHPISETPFGTTTQIPISRRFTREAKPFYAPGMEPKRGLKEEIEKELVGEKLKIKDKAEQIWIEMNKKKTKEEKLNYLNSLGDELTDEVKEKMMSFKKYRQAVEVLKITDSIELRARYILQRLDEMKQQGLSKEDKLKFLNDLEKTKILSQKVKDRIWELKNQ